MKTGQYFFLKDIFVCLVLAAQSLEAQVTPVVPEPRKDVRKSVDTSWNQLSAGVNYWQMVTC